MKYSVTGAGCKSSQPSGQLWLFAALIYASAPLGGANAYVFYSPFFFAFVVVVFRPPQ